MDQKYDSLLSAIQSLSQRIEAIEHRATNPAPNQSLSSSPAHKKSKKGETSTDNSSKYHKAVLHILYAVLNENEDEEPFYTFPNLTNTGIELLSQPDTTSFNTIWKTAHNAAKNKAKHDKKALSPFASSQFIASNVLVKKVLSGSIFNVPLGRISSLSTWKNDWSLAHFATPVENQDWTSFVQQQRDEFNSDLQYQPESIHATRKNFNLFFQGFFDQSTDTILSCIANFIVFSTALVSVPSPWEVSEGNPLIINIFLELSEFLINGDNKSALAQSAKAHPHLYFMIFGFFQDILGEMGQILTAGDATKAARSIDDPTDAYLSNSLFKTLETQAHFSRDELAKLVRFQTPPPAPSAYLVLHPQQDVPQVQLKSAAASQPVATIQPAAAVHHEEPWNPRASRGGRGNRNMANAAEAIFQVLAKAQNFEAQGKNSNYGKDKNKLKEGKGDWLEITGGTSLHAIFPLPQGLYFCLKHAVKGYHCPNKGCKNKHLGYSDLSNEQKALLESHLSEVNKESVKFFIPK